MLRPFYYFSICIALTINMVCPLSLAQEIKTDSSSPPSKEDMVMDRIQTVAGFKDAQAFKKFFMDFQLALSRNDKSAVAQLISFPVRLNKARGKIRISNAKQLGVKFDEAFPVYVKTAVKNQVFEELFVQSQGVMVGDGEIWFIATESGKPRLIINVNDQKN